MEQLNNLEQILSQGIAYIGIITSFISVIVFCMPTVIHIKLWRQVKLGKQNPDKAAHILAHWRLNSLVGGLLLLVVSAMVIPKGYEVPTFYIRSMSIAGILFLITLLLFFSSRVAHKTKLKDIALTDNDTKKDALHPENNFKANANLSPLLDEVKCCIIKTNALKNDRLSSLLSRIDEIKSSLRIVKKDDDVRLGPYDVNFNRNHLPKHTIETLKEAYDALDGDNIMANDITPEYYPPVRTSVQHLYFLIKELKKDTENDKQNPTALSINNA